MYVGENIFLVTEIWEIYIWQWIMNVYLQNERVASDYSLRFCVVLIIFFCRHSYSMLLLCVAAKNTN